MELDLAKLNESIRHRLINADLITPHAILSLTEDELRDTAFLNHLEVEIVCNLASETINPKILTGNIPVEMLSTGCQSIDNALHGGLMRGSGITEITGESGSGKTQFCLQLSLMVQNSVVHGGFGKEVIYLCTENNFPSKRLDELINNIRPPLAKIDQLPYTNNIHIARVPNADNLKFKLDNIEGVLNIGKIGLLVIDSIAALFRSDFSNDELKERAKELRLIGNKLHKFANKHNLCIVCINQVTASIEEENSTVENQATAFLEEKYNSVEDEVIPSLGLVWSNLVTTRIFLRKLATTNAREFQILYSPHVPPDKCNFTIDSCGINDYTG